MEDVPRDAWCERRQCPDIVGDEVGPCDGGGEQVPHGETPERRQLGPIMLVLEALADQSARERGRHVAERRNTVWVEGHHRHIALIARKRSGDIALVSVVVAPRALHLDQERHAPVDDAEQPVERQDAVLAVAQGNGAKGCGIAVGHGSAFGGQPIQGPVMKYDGNAMRGALQIDLDGVALGDRSLDR